MALMLPLKIVSTGKALPSCKMTAAAIDNCYGFKPGFTLDKGGVQVRHFASNKETQSGLAARALHDALARASLPIESVDLLISACGVQEQALPSTACAIAAAAGLKPGTLSFDVNASCLSFMAALQVAASMLQSGGFKRVAVVSADLASRGLDWSEPEASLIFGDGAACAILEAGDGTIGIEGFLMETYPEGRAFCEIRAGGTARNPRMGVEDKDFLFRMNGKAVFKLASKLMPSFLDDLCARARCHLEYVDVVVPHQASHLGMAHIVKRLGLPKDRVINIYETHGNQVAASIPTALHEAFITGKAAPGKRVMLVGTAAGLTIGGMIIQL
jgi:3-oxoacyl-[acyl-carrier-protein] synthase-3